MKKNSFSRNNILDIEKSLIVKNYIFDNKTYKNIKEQT